MTCIAWCLAFGVWGAILMDCYMDETIVWISKAYTCLCHRRRIYVFEHAYMMTPTKHCDVSDEHSEFAVLCWPDLMLPHSLPQ